LFPGYLLFSSTRAGAGKKRGPGNEVANPNPDSLEKGKICYDEELM